MGGFEMEYKCEGVGGGGGVGWVGEEGGGLGE
jgi:hypothetical protein